MIGKNCQLGFKNKKYFLTSSQLRKEELKR